MTPSSSSIAPGAAAPRSTRRAVAAVAVLCFSSLCAALMQSLVIPIQGELPVLLSTSAANASWVVTATLLGAAVAMPVTGRLADMYGKKPVLIASAAILLVGSLICAMSDSVGPMLVGRVLQGTAMGYIPVAISMVRETAPPHLRNTAVAGVSATLGVGGALGLPLAAWIAQDFDWHALFWVSAALAAIMITLTAIVVPQMRDAHPGRLDIAGAIGLAAGLVGVLVGVTKGNDWGWGDSNTLGMISGGILVLLLWGWYELRHREPLIDLRTTARTPVLLTNIAAVLIGFGMMAQSIVVPQLLQTPEATGHGLGQTIMQTGLWMAPAGIMMMLFTPVSSRMLTQLGARITLAAGAAVIALGYTVAVFLMNAPWQLMLASCVASAGVGIGYAAMPTLILTNVPPSESAASVGLNGLMRSMGTTIAGAVMAVALTSQTTTLNASLPAMPTQGAFQLCFIIGAAAAITGALIVLLIPRHKHDDTHDVTDDGAADARESSDETVLVD
ncbi:MFS transporter [Phytoactinopolyspora halotolerans]|uniref:MFS transporter n=1 Tax=Phytoactinopolyspora halotolerans TaxID=1981512 RepID=A0A6L9SGR1_9ACTN|nr:MFS transporter [Phytoactinopolyspora halotolerans]NEE04565.1 MFS transporter [Phytoactinopolyspora halotolerans]